MFMKVDLKKTKNGVKYFLSFIGFGEFSSHDGIIYSGKFEQGMRWGFGLCKWPDNRADGEKKEEKKQLILWTTAINHVAEYHKTEEDKVREKLANLSKDKGGIKFSTVYSGDWLDNKFHGFGQMLYSNNNIYEGDWKHGMRHGEGTLRFHDGSKYRGSWFADLQHGIGLVLDRHGHQTRCLFQHGECLQTLDNKNM